MKRLLMLSLVSILLVLTLTPVVLADSTIHFSLNSVPSEGEVGDTVVVPVAIQSLPDNFTSSIITFGLVVNYDPTYLNVEGITPGSIGQTVDFDSNYSLDPTSFDNTKGQVIISYSTTGTGLTQAGVFYNISFKLKAKPVSGTTNLSLTQRTLPDGTPFDFNSLSYTPVYAGAAITITEAYNDLIIPVLSNVTSGSISVGSTVTATSNETGTIYLVPAATAANKNDIQTASQTTNGSSHSAVANTAVELSTSGFAPGSYVVYAEDAAGNLSVASQPISIKDNKIYFQVNQLPNALVGDTIVVPVSIQSLPSGLDTSIITFGLILNYNPTYLQLVGVSPGSIGQTTDFDSNYSLDPSGFDHTKGQLIISYSTTGVGITETGIFYNASFKVLAKPAEGSSVISLTLRTQPDGTAFDSESNPNSYVSQYNNGTISIGDAPDECFIATACFGSKYQPSVVLLRQFRDKYLLTNGPGQAFVKFYYNNSPPIAAFIANNGVLKAAVRGVLTPVVGIVYLLFHPLLIYALAGMLILALATWWLRRKNKPMYE